MPGITKAQVSKDVKKMLSIFTNQPENKILDSDILTNAPLHMDNTSLNFLTLSLRGYIKNEKGSATILASEVKKANLTVKNLVDVVFSKL